MTLSDLLPILLGPYVALPLLLGALFAYETLCDGAVALCAALCALPGMALTPWLLALEVDTMAAGEQTLPPPDVSRHGVPAACTSRSRLNRLRVSRPRLSRAQAPSNGPVQAAKAARSAATSVVVARRGTRGWVLYLN